jgi:hypothetical protein
MHLLYYYRATTEANELDELMNHDGKDEDDSSKVDHLVPFREQLRKAL